MKFVLEVNLENNAFEGDSGELRRVAGKAAREAEMAWDYGAEVAKKAVMDINGNTVGFWSLTQEDAG